MEYNMKYLKKIELKDINTNNIKKEIKESYQKGTEYYNNIEKKTDN